MPLRFNIDKIHKKVVEGILEELSIDGYECSVSEYEDYISAEELVDFHCNLYKEGRIDFTITCLTSAYERLKTLGIPVYRIVPTAMSIRETLQLANLEDHLKQAGQ